MRRRREMKTDPAKRWPGESEEALGPQPVNRGCRVSRVGLAIVLCLIAPTLASAQNAAAGPPPGPDAQKCAALAQLNLEGVPGGPALITSARLVDVPASGLEELFVHPSGDGAHAAPRGTRIPQYCGLTGYRAPQNKFQLKLPSPGDCNQKFFFYACGGFCDSVLSDACNRRLAP